MGSTNYDESTSSKGEKGGKSSPFYHFNLGGLKSSWLPPTLGILPLQSKEIPLLRRQDLLKLYGMVVKYYEDHPLAGAGMMLWGDLQVLFESHEGGHGSLVWSDQQQWHIRSWRLFPFSNVHVLETISGKVVYMFADGSYPLSVQLMKKMLKHKLEIEIDGVGNDMTYAEQLIQFIKNQIAASIPSA
ncbi:hypothetical protein Tco_0084980 [Tanacetum coccineum]